MYYKIIESGGSCSRFRQENSNIWKFSAVIRGKTTTKTPVSRESVVVSPKTYYKIPSLNLFCSPQFGERSLAAAGRHTIGGRQTAAGRQASPCAPKKEGCCPQHPSTLCAATLSRICHHAAFLSWAFQRAATTPLDNMKSKTVIYRYSLK